ncbi:MAG TPA: hypothetical protein VKV26_15615 [Dehalococcoidia bacterium]|nr:hypothetical protein [Dehalococcoidia bacterium]
MAANVALLEAAVLFAHARAAAREDEARHSLDISSPRSSQQNELTVRGWGGAALNDLEWASHCVYPKEQREEFRRVYAAEYLQRRLARSGAP